ncbi:hypothetical protein BBP40_006887 [Aspergillus hancockii]|nr:hypothetical protein BBP40_006887 [Aspergillus hancockii]
MVEVLILGLGAYVTEKHLRHEHLEHVLAQAADDGQLDIIELLTIKLLEDLGAQIPSETYGKALETAVQKGRTEVVKCLVQETEVDVNMPASDAKNTTLPGTGLLESQLETATVLVSFGANPGVFGSALAVTAAQGKPPHVKCLVEHGAKTNMRLQYGILRSALAAAAVFAGFSIMQELEVLVDSFRIRNDETQEARSEIVEYLAARSPGSANLPLSCRRYGVVLAAAAVGGNTQGVRYLVTEAGSDVNMPLHLGGHGRALAAAAAARYARKNIVEF